MGSSVCEMLNEVPGILKLVGVVLFNDSVGCVF